ncbi:MAG TPA: hypothetical protein VIV40_33560 [Kofleriaceae bacterium]
MFKVIAPLENDSGTYWMRCGSAFVNKDNSINVYLDALPLKTKQGEGVKLQLREYTDAELRERAEKKATYSARGTLTEHFTAPAVGANTAAAAADGVPF